MCNHVMIKMNDLNICTKCGMTIANGKKVIFDRGLSNYVRRKEKNKKRK